MSVLLVIAILMLCTVQGNGMTVNRTKRGDPCPKLEFLSSSGCRPCSLCDPSKPNFDPLLVWKDCKEKNLDVVQGAKKLWCDHPDGPYPECPPIPEEVQISCTDACKTYHRRFAPGCQCQVGCRGDQASVAVVVNCTQDLVWSGGSIPRHCQPPTTAAPKTTAAVTTTVATIIAPTAAVVSVIAVVLAVYCYVRRQKSESTMSSSVSTSDGSEKSEKPLLGSEKVEKDLALTAGASKAGNYSYAQPASQQSLSQRSRTSVAAEVEIPRHGIEEDIAPERVALVGGAPSPPPPQPTSPASHLLGSGDGGGERLEDQEEEKKKMMLSQQALRALLQNRQALVKMMRLFDQKDQFDKVTWHNVAMEFAGWDIDQINSAEYMLRSPPDCSPGDSFIYQVLNQAYNAGKGLLELLKHLENRQHVRHPEAERFLRNFWEDWEKQQQQNCAGAAAAAAMRGGGGGGAALC